MAAAEEKLRVDLNATVTEEITYGDFTTKKDLKDLEVKIEGI
jgi:hypothetical protein